MKPTRATLRQPLWSWRNRWFSGDFEPNWDKGFFATKLMRKDVGLATQLAREFNVPMALAVLAEQELIEAINRAGGDAPTTKVRLALAYTSAYHLAQVAHNEFFRLRYHAVHDLAGWQDGIDEACILANQNRGILHIPRQARGPSRVPDRLRLLSQGPFSPGPLLDETIAQGTRHSARPDLARGNIGNLCQHGIVPSAVHDGLLEVGVQGRFIRRQEARAQ